MIRYSTEFDLVAKSFLLVGQESGKLDTLKSWPVCVLHPKVKVTHYSKLYKNLNKPVGQVSLQGVELIKNFFCL